MNMILQCSGRTFAITEKTASWMDWYSKLLLQPLSENYSLFQAWPQRMFLTFWHASAMSTIPIWHSPLLSCIAHSEFGSRNILEMLGVENVQKFLDFSTASLNRLYCLQWDITHRMCSTTVHQPTTLKIYVSYSKHIDIRSGQTTIAPLVSPPIC